MNKKKRIVIILACMPVVIALAIVAGFEIAKPDPNSPPEASTVEISHTACDLTATVRDQFNNAMAGVNVTWRISREGFFSGTPESQTDVAGEAGAVITCDETGAVMVTCQMIAKPSVFRTITTDCTCLTDVGAWQEAVDADTIESYAEYLQSHPEGEYADEAKGEAFRLTVATSAEKRTEAEIAEYYTALAQYAPDELRGAVAVLSEKWREFTGPFWESNLLKVNRSQEVNQAADRILDYAEESYGHRVGVCLGSPKCQVMVEQTYGEADEVSLPFFEYAGDILKYADFEAAEEDAETFHATLYIDAEGEAVGANYIGVGWRWTGASLEGEISLSVVDKTFSWDFSGSVTPSPGIVGSSGWQTRNDAPFGKAFNVGFLPALFKAVGELKGLPPLISALEDGHPYVATAATKALGEIGDAGALEALIAVLEDPDFFGRPAAAEALGKIGDARAVEPLISVLQDPNSDVRSAAAEALGKIGDARAIEPLISALEDHNSGVRSAAAEALEQLGWKSE